MRTNMIVTVGLLTLLGCVEGEPFEGDGGALVPLDGYLADASAPVDPRDAMRAGPVPGVITGAEPSASMTSQAAEDVQDPTEIAPSAERTTAMPGARAELPADEAGGCTLQAGHSDAGWIATLMLSLLFKRWRRATRAPARAAHGR